MNVRTHLQDLAISVNVFVKFVLSFRKNDWGLEDYPVHYLRSESRDYPTTWLAMIVHWPLMLGSGDTRKTAYDSLRENFEHFKRESELPRPGVFHFKCQIAPDGEISRFDSLAAEFFPKVLELSHEACLVTDMSSLDDFIVVNRDVVAQRVAIYYGVNLANIPDRNLVDVFKAIESKQKTQV